MNKNVLLIDNDPILCQEIQHHFTLESFNVHIAIEYELILQAMLNPHIDAIIMEMLLPSHNGLSLLKMIRKHSNVPVVCLTQHDKEEDKLIAFDHGADDYLQKPCPLNELTARLKAILRRAHSQTLPLKNIIDYQDLKIDCTKRIVTFKQNTIPLTHTEFNILEILAQSPGRAFSKEELTQSAIGRKFTAYDRSIDVHISNLRHKLGKNDKGEHFISTIRGFGYLLNG